MVDEKERFRKFLNMQYVKMKRMAAVGSLVLLAVNLSFTIYPYVEHRDIHPYLGVPIIFVIIVLLIWLAAHIYVQKLEMYRTESLADKIFNPYTIYQIGPFEEMKYRNMELPIMKSLCKGLKGDEKKEMEEYVKRVEKWLELGYIPKDDFPEHLKKYYITKKENRL